MSAERLRVRRAVATDAATVVRLVRALAEFEGEPAERVRLTEADLERDAFGAHPSCEILIGEIDGAPAGFALFFSNYSTWEGRAGIYLEDLFVEPAARGRGLGRALVATIARIARDRGSARIDLAVLDWNERAQRLYERLGMRAIGEWVPYRMERDRIEALAEQSEPLE